MPGSSLVGYTSALLLRSTSLALVIFTAPAAQAGDSVVVRVAPSGGDDTPVLQAALDRCVNATFPCTVRLAPGTYKTRQLVAYNFRGTFEGAGPGETGSRIFPAGTLKVCPGLCPDNPDTTTNLWPSLVIFVDGNIRISNMSFHLTTVPATTPYRLGTVLIDAVRVMGKDVMNVAMDRVSIEGAHTGERAWGGYNLLNCTSFAGELLNGNKDPNSPAYSKEHDTYPLRGSFKFTANSAHTCFSGFYVDRPFDSRVVLGGDERHGNSTSDVLFGFELASFENTVAEISYNSVSASRLANIIVYPEYFTDVRSHYSIHDNLVISEGGPDGIFLIDNDNAHKIIDATVVHNKSRADPDKPFYGIVHPIGTEGTLIADNDLNGSALWGIYFEGVTAGSAIDNDVSDVTATYSRIFLDDKTSDSTVSGSCSPGDVVDSGKRDTILCSN